MVAPLDDRYLEWLYGQIGSVRNRNPARSYWELSKQLFSREFIWFVANDDNRIEDGKELRDEFLQMQGIDEADPMWMGLGCSMLEMLVALARRASYSSDETPVKWFGEFLDNLGLLGLTDDRYTRADAKDVDLIIDRVIYRQYLPDGRGGLFPLKYTPHDQRKVELWYQMAEYLLERL